MNRGSIGKMILAILAFLSLNEEHSIGRVLSADRYITWSIEMT